MDKHNALYVQYTPESNARQQLLTLQSEAHQQLGSGHVVPSPELHLTVLHFGYYDDVFRQLNEINLALDRGVFDEAVIAFAADVDASLPGTCTLHATGIRLFGPQQSVVVLTLRPDVALIKAYEVTMRKLRVFASSLGIESVADIPSRPRALQVPLKLVPHVSLLKGAKAALDDKAIFRRLKSRELTFHLER